MDYKSDALPIELIVRTTNHSSLNNEGNKHKEAEVTKYYKDKHQRLYYRLLQTNVNFQGKILNKPSPGKLATMQSDRESKIIIRNDNQRQNPLII